VLPKIFRDVIRGLSFAVSLDDMKHRQYCCDASRDLYEEYYSRQNGGEIPVFVGKRFQRGHGLGSILGGFVRRLVLPFIKSNAKNMLKTAAKTGVEVAGDVIDGQSFGDSVKNRVPVGIKRGIENIVFQSAPAKRRRPTKTKAKRRGRVRDIFA